MIAIPELYMIWQTLFHLMLIHAKVSQTYLPRGYACLIYCHSGAPYIARADGEFVAGHAAKPLDSTEPTQVDSPSTLLSEPSDDKGEDFSPEQPDNQQGLWDSQGNPPPSPTPPIEPTGKSISTPTPSPPATPLVLPKPAVAAETPEPPSHKSAAPKPAVAPKPMSKNPHYWKSFGCTHESLIDALESEWLFDFQGVWSVGGI